MVRAFVLVVLVGCGSRDGGGGGDGGVGPLHEVTYADLGTVEIRGASFRLVFPGGSSGFRYPIALQFPDTDVNHLGRGGDDPCDDEEAIGMGLSPAPRIGAFTDAERTTNVLVAPLRGPAVVQVEVSWSTTIQGQDGAGAAVTRRPRGTSRFTAFPDGSVVRQDTMLDEVATATVVDSLACAGGTELYPTSFTALANLADTDEVLYLPGETATPLPQTGTTASDVNDQPAACLDYGDRQIAVAWRGVTPGGGVETRIRAPKGDTLAFVRDLITEHPTTIGAFSYPEGAPEAGESALFFHQGANGCGAGGLLARAERFSASARPTLTFSGPGGARQPAADGIFGGAGAPVAVADGVVEISGETPGGFAVWLALDRDAAQLTVDRPGAVAPFHLAQQRNDRHWILWFRDPLTSGQTITVTAN